MKADNASAKKMQEDHDKEVAKAKAVDDSVAATIKSMEDKVKWQRMINAGKEREVEIEKVLAAATDKAKRPLRPDEVASLSASAGALFDASQPAGKRQALAPVQGAELTDSIRRMGGALSGGGAGASANKTTSLLTEAKDRLKSIDDKTKFPTLDGSGGRWPA